MSKSGIKYFFRILILSLIFSNYSCGDMDSIHEDYLQGEQVYAGKLDTLKIRPGYYRAQLEGQTQFLGNSNQIIIEYDDQTEVYDINSENIENGIYTMILPNLDEKSYEFNVTTQDELGNLSVSQIVAGSSVGDIFVSDQDPREIIDFTFEDDGTYANFFGNAQSENVIFTVIDYENESEEISKDTLFYQDSRIKIEQYKPLGNLQTTSVIQSGLDGIDSIALTSIDYTMPDLPYSMLNKNYIRLVNMPSDNPGTFNNANPSEYLFDDINEWNGNDTYTYNSGPNSIPHHFTIDLGVNTILRRVDIDMLDPVIDPSSNITGIQVWGRDNLDFAQTSSSDEQQFVDAGWVLLHEQQIDGENLERASFVIEPNFSPKRFIRLRATSSVSNESVKFTELTFYGEETESIQLDKSIFSLPNMPSDNPGTFYGADPSNYLFDNNTLYSGDIYGYHSGENAIPGHFTIDLGTSTFLSDVRLDFRPTWSFNGNTPNLIEIWGRLDLSGAETFPLFESSGNTVISEPVPTESFENAGWVLIHTETIDGQNSSNIEFEIENLVKSRFIRLRYVNTVQNSACQFIEISLSGYGSFPID
tara:strand:+ start:10630 stop:12393 length:1764 start_codon:yes stop_codon:yes gene_type:complete